MSGQVATKLEATSISQEIKTLRVLVIVPALNEQENISKVIQSVWEHNPEVDILVINDASGDHTAYVASKAGAHVLSHPFNMGYGAACQTGFKYAYRNNYDYVILIDGDGQHEPSCISDLLAAVQEPDVDIVLGSRWLGISGYKGPLLRKFGKFFFGFLASSITKIKVTDPTTGFQAMSREVAHFFCTDAYPVDYPDADVIIMLDRAGFRVKEVPVIMYIKRGGQSMHAGLFRPIYYGFKMMMSIIMTLLRDDRNLQPRWPPKNQAMN